MSAYLSSYALMGLSLVLGALFFAVAFAANRLLRTETGEDAARTSYECGLDPVGGDWAQMQVRYYVYGFLYALFAVEAVFLFPWAVIYAESAFGAVTAAEMGVFVAVLALGLAYCWRKGVLRWA